MKVSTTFSSLLFLVLLALNTSTYGQQPGADRLDTTTGAGIDVLACWDFSNLSPASTLTDGTRVEDSCNDHDSRVIDGLDVIEGVRSSDGALAFNSTSPNALVFEPGHDFGDGGPVAGPEFDFLSGDGITLEALIRVPESFTGFGSIVSKDVGPGQASWWFRVNNGVLQGYVGDDQTGHVVTGARPINDGQWHHVALVRESGNSLNLYVDYQLDVSVAIPVQNDIATPAGTPIIIGDFNYAVRRLEGDIQMVRISRAALSPSQFQGFDQTADLSVTIDHDGQLLDPGSTTSFEITFSNAGPASATNVAVEALLPVWIDSATWTCTPDSGASCSASGTGDLVDPVDLPANHSVVYTLDANLAVGGSGEDEFIASINPGSYLDFDLVNNHASIPVQFLGSEELACWDFSNLNPASTLTDGDRVEDTCNDHDARVLDGLDVVDGLVSGDGALVFNGSSSDALVFEPDFDFGDGGPLAGSEFDFTGDDSFTLEAIVRIPSSFTGAGGIISKDVGGGQASWWFRVNNGVLQALISDGTSQSIAGSEIINDGGWHHVALVRDADSNTLNLYVDYQLDQSEATAPLGDIATPDDTPIALGAFNSGARQLQGDMQMARISRAALPASAFLLHDDVAILNLGMDHDGELLNPGGTTQYVISLTNPGPMPANAVDIEAPMPAGFAAATWSCTADGGASCSTGGTGNLSDTANLPANSSVVYTVDVNLDPSLPPLVTYSTTIESGGQVIFGDTEASVTTPRAGLGRLYVRQSAQPGGDGTSWGSAFNHLQDALSTARELTEFSDIEVWVAQGLYFPDEGMDQTSGDRDAAFLINNNIAIYGGFAGNETELSERDWVANPTVLSGDIDGNDTANATGVTEHHDDIVGDNSHHVVRANEVNPSAILDGFVITGGLANGGAASPIDGIFERRHGAGVNLYHSRPQLRNLVVQGNRANLSDGQGGGIYMRQVAALPFMRMAGLTLRGNAAYRGGGLYARNQDYGLQDCLVDNNNAVLSGGLGGLFARFEIQDCRITGNQAANWGGGMGATSSRGAIINSLFAGNHSGADGGGLWIGPNTTQYTLLLTNVTFSANLADNTGGAIYHNLDDTGTTTMYNTIVWNNSDSSGTGTPGSSHGGPGAARLTASHSLLQGLNPPGSGNLDGTDPGNNPLFIDPLEPTDAPQSGGNYRVAAGSPVIDKGDNQARISRIEGTFPDIPLEGNLLHDLDGAERIIDGDGDTSPKVDLGPYESAGVQGHLIGGEVIGLVGSGLVLQNNGIEDLAIDENGTFTFSIPVGDGHDYQVIVLDHPVMPFQTCTLTNGSGTVTGNDVTDIEVNCQNDTVYTIGGNVSGLSGSGLVLRNNGGDDLPISANGPFSFPQSLPTGTSYEVSVLTHPDEPAQTCTVSNGAGVVNEANVSNIDVFCEDLTFSPIACWDFSMLASSTSLPLGHRVEDSCNDHDAYVTDELDVIDGASPGSGALAFHSSTPDALVFEPSYEFGDGGPVAGSEFDFAGNESFTLEAVVRIPPSFTGVGGIISKDVGSGQASWWFRVNNGLLQGLISDGSPEVVNGNLSVNDGSWHHVALVRDAANATLSLYVDYQLDASVTTPPIADIATPEGTPIVLGAFNSGSRQLQGDMQMARITDTALPDSAFLLHDDVSILNLDMAHDGEQLNPGGTTQYVISLSNAGPMPANAVVVEAPMPAGFAAMTWSCTADGGASCSAGGSGNLNDTADLPANSSVVYTVDVDLAQSLPPLVTYTATIESGVQTIFGNTMASVSTPRAGSERLYVRQSAQPGGDGASWDSAFNRLQDALSAAHALTEYSDISVWVARGRYYPDEGTNQLPGNRDAAFLMGNNIAIYGGFAGFESELSDRDWTANPTILSGDIDGNDIVNAFGIVEHYDDISGSNSYHVVRAFGVDDSAILDGFVITGGLANSNAIIDGRFLARNGAGLYLHSSHPTVNNLVVQGNRANEQGGGIHLYRDSGNILPTLQMTDIILRGNGAAVGGGMSSERMRFLLDNCRIEDNDAESAGGLYGWLVVFEINNCRIAGNQATRADGGGGGLRTFRGRVAIVNTLISGNRAAGDGGGIWINPHTLDFSYVLTNVTFSGNHAEGDGGAIYHHQADWGMNHLNNAIIWNNSDSSGSGTPGSSHGGPGAARLQASNSLIQGMNPTGTGNLDGTESSNDPLFINPLDPANAPSSSGNFHVDLTSPTIDQGDNQARISLIIGSSVPHLPIEGNILFDLDGNERIVDGTGDETDQIDLGPYESLGVNGRWIGGEVSGLAGAGLVLQNNGSDHLAIIANGEFAFTTPLGVGSSYNVTVVTQPTDPLQLCTVTNGDGEINGGDVTDIVVDCVNREDMIFSDRYEN